MFRSYWLNALRSAFRLPRRCAKRRRPFANGLTSVETLEIRQLLSANPVGAEVGTFVSGNTLTDSTTMIGAATISADQVQRMYRCFNPNAGFTIYTTQQAEFDTLLSWGYQDQTNGWSGFAVVDSSETNARPIHRLYNPNNSQHYFTLSDYERNFLASVGWSVETDMGSAFLAETRPADSSEVFMFYSHSNGDHVFTTDLEEVARLQSQSETWEQQTSLGFAVHVRGNTPSVSDNTLETARDLGTLSDMQIIHDYVGPQDTADYFRVTLGQPGRFELHLTGLSADLDVALQDAAGNLIAISEAYDATPESITQMLAAGTYFVQVYPWLDAASDYTLSIGVPALNGSEGDHVLYLVTEGASISSSDLIRWAGDDWRPSVHDYLDTEGDGIVVQRFLESSGSRDAIIDEMIQLLEIDLQPFGIEVRRHIGTAIENERATTIFLGSSTLYSTPHVACDIDVGNDNATDIAFVTDEYWATSHDTALALADVVLHEAGHTWGLYHVESGSSIETMGRRYSLPQDQWLADTTFVDQSFPIRNGHGPSGYQNSYQVLSMTFAVGVSDQIIQATPEGSFIDVRDVDRPQRHVRQTTQVNLDANQSAGIDSSIGLTHQFYQVGQIAIPNNARALAADLSSNGLDPATRKLRNQTPMVSNVDIIDDLWTDFARLDSSIANLWSGSAGTVS